MSVAWESRKCDEQPGGLLVGLFWVLVCEAVLGGFAWMAWRWWR